MATKYDDYIRRSILANNEFGITEVSDFEHLNSRYLDREEYPMIAKLATAKDIDANRRLPPNSTDTIEYLIILEFTDQKGNDYIVTTYDTDLIWQDPKVIDIFKL